MIRVCPTEDNLHAFLDSALDSATSQEISSHVESCDRCASVVRRAAGEDASLESRIRDLMVRDIGLRTLLSATRDSNPQQTNRLPDGWKAEDFELTEHLGEGGMGSVYKATHKRLKRVVAVKVLQADRLTKHVSHQRFYAEMEAIGRVDHDNLVRAMDAGEAGGIPFLVMEHINGSNLRDIVDANGPLSTIDACEVARQIAEGLKHIHELGLVHRDIKPSNLMLTVDGVVKILDLGIARISDESTEISTKTVTVLTDATPNGEESNHSADAKCDEVDHNGNITKSGMLLGTKQFMAPEQALDARIVDYRTDMFALGCSLFYLLTGEVPYRTRWDRESAANEVGKSVRAKRETIPKRLDLLVSKMICPNVERRCIDAIAVVSELQEIIARLELPKSKTSMEIAPPTLAGLRNRISTYKQEQKRKRLRRSLTAGTFCVLLATALTAICYPKHTSPTSDSSKVEEDAIVRVKLESSESILHNIERIDFPDDLSFVRIKTLDQPARYVSWDVATGGKLSDKLIPRTIVVQPTSQGSRVERLLSLDTIELSKSDTEDYSDPTSRGVVLKNGRTVQTVRSGSLCFSDSVQGIITTVDSGIPVIERIAISADMSTVAVTGDGTLSIWDFETQSRLAHFNWQQIKHVALSHDGALVATINHDGEVTVANWEMDYAASLTTVGTVEMIAFSPSDNYLGYIDESNKMSIIDPVSFDLRWRLRHELADDESALGIGFSQDNDAIAVLTCAGFVNRLSLTRRATDKPREGDVISDSNNLPVEHSQLSIDNVSNEDDMTIFPTLSAFGLSFQIKVKPIELEELPTILLPDVSPPQLELATTLVGHTGRATSLDFSSDGEKLISGSDDRTIRIFDVKSGQLDATHQRHSSFVRDVWLAEAVGLLHSLGTDRKFKTYRWPDMVEVSSVQLSRDSTSFVATSSPHEFIVASSAGSILHVDTERAVASNFASLASSTFEVALASTDSTVLAGDVRGDIYLFDTRSDTSSQILTRARGPIISLAISETQGLLAAGLRDGRIQVWSWPDAESVGIWQAHDVPISALQFSDANQYLASGCRKGHLRIWDTKDSLLVSANKAHPSTIRDIDFSPQGDLVATASHDATIKLWHVPAEEKH